MYNIFHLFLVHITFSCQCIDGVHVKIGGNIDLGPEWSFEFKPVRKDRDGTSKHETEHVIHIPDVVSKMLENFALKNQKKDEELYHKDKDVSPEKFVLKNKKKDEELYLKDRDLSPKVLTKAQNNLRPTEETVIYKITAYDKITTTVKPMYVVATKVKHDNQIAQFTKHLYKQSMKVFDSIKEKATDEDMKNEIEFLARSYEERFGDFVRETQNQRIKTRLGRQKVIINTLETSNLILKRLINFLLGTNKKLLRSEVDVKVFQNEIKKKMDIETTHICKKFGICRNLNGFNNFMTDLITICLSVDNNKFKKLVDSFTEVMKYTNFTRIMDKKTHKRFKKGISDIEVTNTAILKSLLLIIKNVMANRNKPIQVVGEIDKRVNKTVGVLDIIEAFEIAIPPNEKNRLEWEDMKRSIAEWKDGKRTDILEIMQSLIDHIKKGVDNFSDESAADVRRSVDMLLGYMYPERSASGFTYGYVDSDKD